MNTTKEQEMEKNEYMDEAGDVSFIPGNQEPEINQKEPNVSLLDEEGNFCPNWHQRYESLAEDSKALNKFKSPEALAKSYACLERMKKYPGIESSDKMIAFRRMVGLPDNQEEYSLEKPEGADEAFWDDGFAGQIAKVAYDYGVPPVAMEALGQTYYEAHRKAVQESEENEKARYEQADRILQEEWGNGYDSGMRQVALTIKKMSDRAGVSAELIMEDPAIGSNPAFIRMMREVARVMDETPLKGNEGALVSPDQEAKRIESDPTHPLHEAYMNYNHPNHKYANEMYDKLAFGDKK